jgi:signal peptidase I
MRITLLLLFFTAICSCKGGVYRAPSNSMAETIREGETFYIRSANQFNRNDIVAFNYYGDDYMSAPDDNGHFQKQWEKRFCRLVAISGDSLQIRNDTVYLNGRALAFPPGAKLMYKIYASSFIDDEMMALEEYNQLGPAQSLNNQIIYQLALSRDQLAALQKKYSEIIQVEHAYPEPIFSLDTTYATLNPALHWNNSNYGPIRIPAAGETIEVTTLNYKLYQAIPGIKMGLNKIKEQLYFVLGDNRHMCMDSRFIGLLAHSNMYGIVK